jgi:hypothetical protein
MGINDDKFEVEEIDIGEFFINMALRNRLTNMR